jgi:Na+/H+-translocating membrane pyrophosphatase
VREEIVGSRKLTGLVIGLGALLLLCIVAAVFVVVWGAPWELFGAFGSMVSGLVGMHQGAQASQDRAQAYSPNWPAPAAAEKPVELPKLEGQ